MRAREVNRAIERRGGVHVRITGGHRRYRASREDVTVFTTVPQHPGDLAPGTLRGIERDLEPSVRKEMAAMSYTVTVTREAGYWLAEVAELTSGAHTEARTLGALDTAVREIIVLAEDLPDEAMPDLELAYEYRTGDKQVDKEAAQVRRDRAYLAELDREVTARTEATARRLVSQGYSVRDAAVLTGVSYQRVSQLTHRGRRDRERQRLARRQDKVDV